MGNKNRAVFHRLRGFCDICRKSFGKCVKNAEFIGNTEPAACLCG